MAAKKKEEETEVNLTLLQKLLEIKKSVSFIKKDTKGHNYTYASPSAVLGAINPLLNEYGILLEQRIKNVESKRVFAKPNSKAVPSTNSDGKTVSVCTPFDVFEEHVSIWFDMTWVDVESGDERVVPFFAQGMNGDDKGVGSAMTYAERYFMLKYFNIPTDDDDPDWLANKPEKPTPKAAEKPAPKPTEKPTPKPTNAAPTAKELLDDVLLQTMIKYIKQGLSDAVVQRLGAYEYTDEQYKKLVTAGMPPLK